MSEKKKLQSSGQGGKNKKGDEKFDDEWLIKLINESDVAVMIGASSGGHLEVLKMLLSIEGVNVNVADDTGATALYIACAKGHLKIVQLLLKTKNIQVNQSLVDGQSPIFAAAEGGHPEGVRLLLEVGADMNARVLEESQIDSNCTGLTPLGVAKKRGHDEVVALLAAAGATL